MTPERLQEIENSIGRIECPACGGSGVYLDGTTGNEACEECDGSGMVSQFAPADDLIAEIRRLTAERDEAVAARNVMADAEARSAGHHLARIQEAEATIAATLREQLQAAQALLADALDGIEYFDPRLYARMKVWLREQAHPTPAQEGQ